MRRLLLAAALLLTACDATDVERSGALLQTDATGYDTELMDERVTVTIPYTMRSPDDARTVYIGCQPPETPVVQKLTGGEWRTVYSPVRALCLSAPFVLDAGASRADTLRLSVVFPSRGTSPDFDTDEIPGTYRLVQAVYAGRRGDGQGRDLLPLAARASNAFELR